MKSDIIFLQETHSKIETENQWEREWGGKMLFSHGSRNARGVAVSSEMDSTSVLIPLKSTHTKIFSCQSKNRGQYVYLS